ncbi:MAG: cell division protein FtsZ [Anaerolineae bacterium]|jgi:cell division protein FtsZ
MEATALGGAQIKVVGVGGAGSNAVDRMIQVGVSGVDFIAANSDAQALAQSEAPHKICLGPELTRSLGTGGDPVLGAEAAYRSRKEIFEALKDADMVFIAAGMGGGTGTGAAPIVAQIARREGALTIAVVTEPFCFEGRRRSAVAEEGIENLRHEVDALIVISNNRLLETVTREISLDIAFRVADDVLRQAVQGISDLVTRPGFINLDFADVRSLMERAGQVLISVGYGEGPNRAIVAAESALESPLLASRLAGRTERILVNVTCGEDLAFSEAVQAIDLISETAIPRNEVLFGVVVDDRMEGRVEITLIATGMAKNTSQFTPLQVGDETPDKLSLSELAVSTVAQLSR